MSVLYQDKTVQNHENHKTATANNLIIPKHQLSYFYSMCAHLRNVVQKWQFAQTGNLETCNLLIKASIFANEQQVTNKI